MKFLHDAERSLTAWMVIAVGTIAALRLFCHMRNNDREEPCSRAQSNGLTGVTPQTLRKKLRCPLNV